MSELRLSNAPDVSLAERLAFERLLGDLSAHFADLPADRVVDKIAGALRPLIAFLGFDRWGFGEVVGAGGQFLVRCSVTRDGIDPTPLGTAPPIPWYFGELPRELPIKLMRVLHDGCVERVGSTRTIQVRVRVIAATNRDLARSVPEVRFREDLYYRLNVFPVVVPPLRQRPEDIPLLAWQFVQELGDSMGKPIEHVADDSMAALLAYPWPGNVRELRNLIEGAIILARGPTLFLTLRVQRWYYLVDGHNRWRILADSIRYCQDNKGLELNGYVFMLNHAHLIVTSPGVAGFLRDFKRFNSTKLKGNLAATEPTVLRLFVDAEGNYGFWMDTNAPEKIENPAFYVQELDYVHENPVRKNYVARPEHRFWSSANPDSALRVRILS